MGTDRMVVRCNCQKVSHCEDKFCSYKETEFSVFAGCAVYPSKQSQVLWNHQKSAMSAQLDRGSPPLLEIIPAVFYLPFVVPLNPSSIVAPFLDLALLNDRIRSLTFPTNPRLFTNNHTLQHPRILMLINLSRHILDFLILHRMMTKGRIEDGEGVSDLVDGEGRGVDEFGWERGLGGVV